MPDQRTLILAHNWAGFVGTRLAAAEMGVDEETLKQWIALSTSKEGQGARKSTSRSTAAGVTNTPAFCVSPDGAESGSRRVRYTQEQKAQALARVAEVGLAAASRETGISVGSLMKWRQEATSTQPD